MTLTRKPLGVAATAHEGQIAFARTRSNEAYHVTDLAQDQRRSMHHAAGGVA